MDQIAVNVAESEDEMAHGANKRPETVIKGKSSYRRPFAIEHNLWIRREQPEGPVQVDPSCHGRMLNAADNEVYIDTPARMHLHLTCMVQKVCYVVCVPNLIVWKYSRFRLIKRFRAVWDSVGVIGAAVTRLWVHFAVFCEFREDELILGRFCNYRNTHATDLKVRRMGSPGQGEHLDTNHYPFPQGMTRFLCFVLCSVG